ncbi:MAG: hypothetical protein M1825_001647 [Sarcosagium campestre]|nr:MAG: hypothetical protein M1825_001647 [Sarcosagium campestre]
MILRLRRHGRPALLRLCSRTCSASTRPYSHIASWTQLPDPKQHKQLDDHTDIGVLGGGITGLATSWYILRHLPNAKVTLYEADARPGGWIQSKRADIPGSVDGSVVFEIGPHSLRPSIPNGMLLVDLMKKLPSQLNVLVAKQSSTAARNRYIYYPDRINRMPGPGQQASDILYSLWTSPVFEGLFAGVLGEPFRPARQPELDDESVRSFISRRFSPHIADNIVSALFHGIFAGDIDQLSVKSLLPSLWHTEHKYGSIAVGLLERLLLKERSPMKAEDLLLVQQLKKHGMWDSSVLADWSVFSFSGGIESLVADLRSTISANPNCRIRLGTRVVGIKQTDTDSVTVTTNEPNLPPNNHDYVISTLPAQALAKIDGVNAPSLSDIPSATVMVVNLYYEQPKVHGREGFGYLIPRSVPFDQNPECALGVIFYSDIIKSEDMDRVHGTKLTVMLGGHWWDGRSGYPTEEEAKQMAKSVLSRHLGITVEPTVTMAHLLRDCIPQFTVGHQRRLEVASTDIYRDFKGRLKVAGASYYGAGVADCIRAAHDVSLKLVTDTAATGLDESGHEPTWVRVNQDWSVVDESSSNSRGPSISNITP